MKKRTKKIIFGVTLGLALALSIFGAFARLYGYDATGIIAQITAMILSCISGFLFVSICKDLKDLEEMQSGNYVAKPPSFCKDCKFWHYTGDENSMAGICDASGAHCTAWSCCHCGEHKMKQPKEKSTIHESVRVVYIAGKMSGLPDLGRAAFMKAERDVAGLGFTPLNPARLPDDMPRERYLPICMAMLEQADGIYMLRGWEDSPGARVELAFAKYQNKAEIYEEDLS